MAATASTVATVATATTTTTTGTHSTLVDLADDALEDDDVPSSRGVNAHGPAIPVAFQELLSHLRGAVSLENEIA